MKSSVDRQTVDLSAFPDLVVIYLGMKVQTLKGLKTFLWLGPEIDKGPHQLGLPDGQPPMHSFIVRMALQ